MTSVVNGTRNGAPVSSGSDSSTASANNTLLNTNSTFTSFQLDNEFNFDIFPTSTWELESSAAWAETRPDSRQSVTPVSTPTPRPPSAPAYSPSATSVAAQSPMPQYVTQPSPSVPNPSTPGNPFFQFSPITGDFQMEEQKDTKVNVMEETSSIANSTKLRNLLSQPQNNPVDSANDTNKHMILKGLLKQPDEDEHMNENRSSPRGRNSLSGPSEKNSNNNIMLIQVSIEPNSCM